MVFFDRTLWVLAALWIPFSKTFSFWVYSQKKKKNRHGGVHVNVFTIGLYMYRAPSRSHPKICHKHLTLDVFYFISWCLGWESSSFQKIDKLLPSNYTPMYSGLYLRKINCFHRKILFFKISNWTKVEISNETKVKIKRNLLRWSIILT